ncbi:hypothetical protein INT47_001189 [Mucor saturninus]|uniref:Uncharacterized protein n=1 Tax=Mucor saturninus TaxID=64648 RepID=A0A8H7VB40_9FUNG|nr:hypothetical protein INT47_001189 [Mucor saturninus]
MPTNPTKVVFLIDEQSLMREDGITLEQLKLAIMRTLIFYHSQPESQEILWGYRFFSTQTRYASGSIRHFYGLTKDSFQAIDVEYQKRENDRQKTCTLGTPMMRLKQVLKEAIGDFQWENTDLGTGSSVKQYMYLLTDCPSNTKELHRFFVSSTEQEPPAPSPFPTIYRPYFQQTREDLASTLSQSYTQRQISLSIVNTRFQFAPNHPMEQLVEQTIRQGFTSCAQQFGGNYIIFKLLIRNYHVYGHSFVSEFANILPHPHYTDQARCQIPVWKGPFKTKLGKSLGNFALFPCKKNGNYQANTLSFISEIRTHRILHASQFSASWLLNDNPVEPDHDYKLTYEPGESPHLINAVLDELYATQSVLIAELVPMAGYEEVSRKVCIEPFSRSSASLRFLNIQSLPNTIRLNQVVVDEEYPVGSYIEGTQLEIQLPAENESAGKTGIKVNMEAPSFIKKAVQSRKLEALKEKRPIRNTKPKKEEHVEKIITLPTSVHMMGKELKKLYLEMLYTQNDTIENTLNILDQWINHLLKTDCSKQDIISTLYDKTMQYEDLDEKHRHQVSFPHLGNKLTSQMTLEQTYLREWWHYVKNRGSSDAKFEKMSGIILKLKELVATLSEHTLKRDPLEMAEKFFKKTVLPYALNDITDFLTEMDSEDGAAAVKRRDPADLNDYVFMQLLEKSFTDLPDLTGKFRENVGMDDMASSPSPISSLDDDDDLDEPVVQLKPQRPKEGLPQRPKEVQPQRPAYPKRSQSDHFQTRRAKSDLEISKHDRKPNTTLSALSKYAKPLIPIPIQRSSSSNSMLDGLQKRMISVSNTKVAESRQAPLKRTGSFTKSAHSPKRTKTSASMLSNDKTGTTVILRRTDSADPKTTPRTSLNRHLGTNLFTEYSEICLSPSSKTGLEDGGTSSQEFLASEYPAQAKTPQGTANRFRRIMNRTPHRNDGDIELMEDELSVPRDEEMHTPQPPYTPRTAAKRAKDRIDRSQIAVHPGRDLTSRFQNIFDEEKQDRPIYKQNHFLFEGEDENVDPFSDNDSSSSSRPSLAAAATTASIMNRTSSFGTDTRKISGLNFVEDSDSESDNESNISLQMDNYGRNYLF